jgi:hypothetical protein
MNWKYTKRGDGLIAVTLDNNAWDFLFSKEIDLANELPSGEFAIFITREVEIESRAIPDSESKAMLKDYIARTITRCGIRTTAVFGFATRMALPITSAGRLWPWGPLGIAAGLDWQYHKCLDPFVKRGTVLFHLPVRFDRRFDKFIDPRSGRFLGIKSSRARETSYGVAASDKNSKTHALRPCFPLSI